MPVLRLRVLAAAAAMIVASAASAAAHEWSYGARGRTVVNCVDSVCNFGGGYYRHHRPWAYARVITPSPYYLVDQGPVFNVPAIPYREPSVIYDIDAGAYPYYYGGVRRTYGPRLYYGGARYRYSGAYRYRHVHRAAYRGGHYRARYSAYGKPYYARHGARHHHRTWH